jgi:hypothetical protein
VDPQNEANDGDRGHAWVQLPPSPTAYCLLPTANKTNPMGVCSDCSGQPSDWQPPRVICKTNPPRERGSRSAKRSQRGRPGSPVGAAAPVSHCLLPNAYCQQNEPTAGAGQWICKTKPIGATGFTRGCSSPRLPLPTANKTNPMRVCSDCSGNATHRRLLRPIYKTKPTTTPGVGRPQNQTPLRTAYCLLPTAYRQQNEPNGGL